MLTLNGKVLPYDQEFQVDGVVYPANWLRNSTSLEKQNIGIVETPAPAYYDRRFYSSPETPKDLAALKVEWVLSNKLRTREILSNTDWEVIKAVDPSSALTEVSPAIIALRTNIRTQSNAKEDDILACTTTAELATLVTSSSFNTWAELPE